MFLYIHYYCAAKSRQLAFFPERNAIASLSVSILPTVARAISGATRQSSPIGLWNIVINKFRKAVTVVRQTPLKRKRAMLGSLGGSQINKKHKNVGGQSKSCKMIIIDK